MGKKNRKVSRKQKKAAPRPERAGAEATAAGHQHEMVGVVFLLAATIVLLSLASFSPTDPIFSGSGHRAVNLVGLVGAYLANALLFTLGVASFLLVAGLGYGAVVAFSRGGVPLTVRRVLGYVTLTVLGTALCHIVFDGRHLLGHPPGGAVGEYAGALFVSLLSTVGSVMVLCAGMVLGLIEVTGFSPLRVFRASARGLSLAARACGRWVARATVFGARQCARATTTAASRSFAFVRREASELVATLREGRKQRLAQEQAEPSLVCGDDPPDALQDTAAVDPLANILAPPVSMPPVACRREPLVVTSDPPPPETTDDPGEKRPKRSFRSIKRAQEPEIVIPRSQDKAAEPAEHEEERIPPTLDLTDYHLPDVSLLQEKPADSETVIEEEQLRGYARTLEEKLADYGVQGQVTKIMPGPVVTMYEYAPAPGIKVSKISGLSNDLALALGAHSVRIIAPIPGRAVVGIEVSNKHRQTVYARELIGHRAFQRPRSRLTLALGKDIEGLPYVADLNKMPHLLVAGATGTGKSVALNMMISSILYRATPDDVRFIMVDPKVLELSLYEGIPHLLLPVVTDPRKAQAALHWAVQEMERRIQVLHAAGVRNLDSYNRKIMKQAEQPAATPGKSKKVFVIDKTADELQAAVEAEPADEAAAGEPVDDTAPKPQKLPHIVIVIDELADLMMASSRDVETAIARIAQKARAAGIHLIIATQRPSVNVITGLIKANLPARISFRVASKTDSRTILDQNGAETLLGNGDMLFHPPTSSQVVRIHGAWITEEEITEMVEHLKAQAQPVYDETILASAEEEADEEGTEDDPPDELYDQAIQIVAEAGQASTSMIQRKLRIGYNRAARLVERMERDGIVGPADGSRPREVLVQNHGQNHGP